MSWKFTDSSNKFVTKTNTDGSIESCLVAVISDWLTEGNTPDPADPIIIPPVTQVSMRQARLVLLQQGLLDTVNTAIAAMTGSTGQVAQIQWQYASVVNKSDPLLVEVSAGFGWTAAQLQDLFNLAATL